MISLVIPCYSSGPDLARTIDSCASLCNDVVIISTAMFPEDEAAMRKRGTVVSLPWNYVFHHGFGELHNQGTKAARNDWLLLFGVAETFAEPYTDIHDALNRSHERAMYRCDHVDDPNSWKRVWNRTSSTKWSGLIHEELTGGIEGGVMFRMQDTHKTPRHDPFETEVLKYLKLCSYQAQYARLAMNPNLLGGTHSSWLGHVSGSREQIMKFCADHFDLLFCANTGDKRGFIDGVRKRFEEGQRAAGVDFDPTASTTSTSTHIVPAS